MAKINTIFGFQDQITSNLNQLNRTLNQLTATLNQMQGQMNNTNRAMGGLSTKLLNFNAAAGVFRSVKRAVDEVSGSVNEMTGLFNFQMEQETKLETVMRNHMHASEAQIQSIKDFANAEQAAGLYGDEMILQGAQELATYIDNTETLRGLIPVLNSMVAQGVGTNATSRDMQSYATMLGKVMQGQVGGMSKRGYKFTKEEEQILKTGTELQKLEVLQNNVLGNFGDMNRALAQTPAGQIKQLNNTFGDLKEQVGKALIPFTQFFTLVTMNWKVKFYQTLINALQFITDHINQVIIALGVLGTVAAAVGLKMAVSWIIANAPMIALVGSILLVTAAIGALLVFSEKTFPAIGGFIGGLGGIAKETGAQIKYYFGVAIEGVVNGFLNMKNRIYNSFLSVFDFLISGVEKVALAMDKVFGTSFASNIRGFRESLNAMKNTEKANFSLGWEDNRRGFAQAWAEGQAAGSAAGIGASDQMNKFIDRLSKKLNVDSSLITGGIQDAFNFGSDNSLTVSDPSNIDIADDYRELLSQRATERFNMKFSQVTPQINIENVEVKGNEDLLDAAVEAVADGFEEIANNTGRGAA